MKILVTYNLPRTPFNNLPADWELTFPQNEEMPREEIIRLLPEYDVLLTIFHSHSPVDREIIDAGKRLRLISNYGVGYNNIDTAYAREKGIAVTNTPRSVCNPTAELAMALMLALARRVAECDRRIRTEKESLWGTMKNLGASLENKTLGIVGMGNIGKNVARKAEAFGMRVIYYNRRTEVSGYRRVPLDTLLQEADFVSLHTPLTTETRHLIGARELSLMKPTAMLINTARGAVIDETALADALRQKRIAGAALDVFENEPHVTDVLYRLDNVVLTPHVGTGTIDTRIAMAEEALANIRNFFQGTLIISSLLFPSLSKNARLLYIGFLDRREKQTFRQVLPICPKPVCVSRHFCPFPHVWTVTLPCLDVGKCTFHGHVSEERLPGLLFRQRRQCSGEFVLPL